MSTLLSQTSNAVANNRVAHVSYDLRKLELCVPFWQAFTAFRKQGHAFLLDSSLSGVECGRYSFLGGAPVAIFQAHRIVPCSTPFEAEIEIRRFRSTAGEVHKSGPELEQDRGDAISALRRLLQQYAINFPKQASRRFPFLGGAVGFFGYESGNWSGPGGSLKNLENTKIPDIYFAIYDRVLCHDTISEETYLSVVGRGSSQVSATQAIDREVQEMQDTIRNDLSVWQSSSRSDRNEESLANEVHYQAAASSHRSDFDQAGYCDAVRTIRNHIEAGDVYQACMTQRFQAEWGNHDPWQLYASLRARNPAPFACFLQTPSFQVVSASPERYLAVDRSGKAESRPIKGTRPRGEDPQQDAALRGELAASEKDQAENVMIVDLVRNDFGRVCRFGSINVSRLMHIETYATVFQMVSTVSGYLATDRDALDLIRATFPGGSMTGAPKIEAMKILNQIEPVRRGIYSGAIGYIDYAGAMDLSMVIRSLIIEEDRILYHAGGGIVADSSPEDEYQESLDKVVALQAALAKVCIE